MLTEATYNKFNKVQVQSSDKINMALLIKQKALCVYNKKGIPNVWTWVSFKYS